MKILKFTLKLLLGIIAIPLLYVLVSLILSIIPVNTDSQRDSDNETIYLSSNGVHLDVVLPIELMEDELLEGLNRTPNDRYFSVGWGEENFYINMPEWSDLTFSTAFNAAFLDNTTLMHITRYSSTGDNWIEVKLSKTELSDLNQYIQNSFRLDDAGTKRILPDEGYGSRDDFYKAVGRYSFHNTCNSWINNGFRESGLKAALWTPFDFGLMGKYE
ncbi:DUF2459 domain-containing protein [Nonlabens antarcticus]|uniref:DUF2459 domain-containing protein n=1 Tax=Nonlabens antarcticus TaxID=392714 RepID=UPI001891813A|nr:DUF2459 domain-containing protein [Nonlabens antarcticus]